MLPKSSRLPRKRFKEVLEKGVFFNSAHFTAKVASSSDQRFAVSVSKKVSRSAVARNRTRRRVYSALSKVAGLRQGLFLVMAKKGSGDLKGEKLIQELDNLLKKAKIA